MGKINGGGLLGGAAIGGGGAEGGCLRQTNMGRQAAVPLCSTHGGGRGLGKGCKWPKTDFSRQH